MPEKTYTEQELERYYRHEPEEVDRAILRFLRESHPDTAVYGARAINAHLPDWLDKDTKDWDILSNKDAEKQAAQLERLLDRRLGGDYFAVEPAKHAGTFRIRSKVTGQVVADVTLQDRQIEFKKIDGINYTTLEFQEEAAKRILDDPSQAFRHSKDRDTLQRIEVFRQTGKKGQRKRKKRSRPQYIDGSSVDTSAQGIRL